MNKTIIIIIMIFNAMITVSQSGPRDIRDANIIHVIIANPTVKNIETVRFLTERRILDPGRKKVRFTGIYHQEQSYDFSESLRYLEEQEIDYITLHGMKGRLDTENIFMENDCTHEFYKLFKMSAATLFFGGPDIQPEIYGEDNLWSEVTDPVRHLFEVSYAFHLTGGSRNPGFQPFLDERPGYLVTGFCLGLQTMNVAAGGTLWQDIPAQIYGKQTPGETIAADRQSLHRNYWQLLHNDDLLMSINLHPIQFTSHPFFGKTIRIRKNVTPMVYSSHHQSPRELGPGYEVTALSPDEKVIEGMAHSRFPNVFAVQFHPEVPALYEDRELWKFEPGDKPRTMHAIIAKEGVRFHRKYWKHISRIITGHH